MKLRLNDSSIYYEVDGPPSAPAVVLLHGFPFNHSMWDDQVNLLKSNFRVVTYDHRGHGLSDVGTGQYMFEFFVDDLIALLDHLEIRQCILGGLSMGGYIALRAVERNPERFRALVLSDTRSEADSNEAKLGRAAGIRTIRKEGLDVFAEGFLKKIFASSSFERQKQKVAKVREMIRLNPPLGVCGALIALATRTETTATLSAIRIPTLVLVGDEDTVTPVTAARSLHEKIAGSQLVTIPQAGHISNLENTAAFNHALLSFLTSIR